MKMPPVVGYGYFLESPINRKHFERAVSVVGPRQFTSGGI